MVYLRYALCLCACGFGCFRNRTFTRPFNYWQQYALIDVGSIDDGCCDILIRMKNYLHCAVAIDVLIDVYDNKRKVGKKTKRNILTQHSNGIDDIQNESTKKCLESGRRSGARGRAKRDTIVHIWCAHKVRSV